MNRLAIAAIALLVVTGCTAPGGTRRFQSRPLPNATTDDALIAARTILKREYGGVTSDGPFGLVTDPITYQVREGTGTARDLYRGQSSLRERAHCQIVQRGGRPVALLRIEVQRRDTATTRAISPERRYRLDDQPSSTPIQEDAATTEAQNEVWTLVRRDTQRERDLLVMMQDMFADEGAAPAAAPAAAVEIEE